MTLVGSKAARRLAVLGSPIGHSKSPALHRAAYAVLGLKWDYRAIEVTVDDLGPFLDGLDGTWRGLSLTMPLKRAVLERNVTAEPLATLTGTSNTLFLSEPPAAFNTDVEGIVRALGAAGVPGCTRALVLGSGATAASAVAAAAALGAESVTIAARDRARAARLQPLARELGVEVRIVALEGVGRDGAASVDSVDLVMSTVPNGVRLDARGLAPIARSSTLLDVAYEPWPTPLARTWAESGSIVVSGLAMLVHQALLQVRVFTTADPDTALPDEPAVLAAMLAAVGLDRART